MALKASTGWTLVLKKITQGSCLNSHGLTEVQLNSKHEENILVRLKEFWITWSQNTEHVPA